MLEQNTEERLEALEKKVEELSAEVEAVKKEQAEELGLIPGAEYDLVPSVEDKVIARGVARFIRFVKASNELGLSPQEWAQFSDDEDVHE